MKSNIKKLLALMLALSMVLALCACGASEETAPAAPPAEEAAPVEEVAPAEKPIEKVDLRLGTSSSGSSPYLIGSAISSVLNGNQPYFELSAQVTGGFKDSLSLMGSGDLDIAMLGAYDLVCAYQSIRDYEGMDFTNIRMLFPYCSEYYHLFCRADSDIYTFDDVVGHKLNINTPSSSGHANNLMIIDAFGYTAEDFDIFEISTSSSYDSMRDKVIDASMAGMSLGNASLTELASSVPVRLLDMPEDVYEKFNEMKLGTLQYGVIPAGTYNGQESDCKAYMSYNMIYATDELDEEVAYQLTKAFWENLKELGAAEAGLSTITEEWMKVGPEGVPYHEGAIRYYKEVGVM